MARRAKLADRPRLWVVDGHSQIYRAIFTRGRPLTSPTGEPTRGTYYFCRMMRALIRDREPDYLVVAMDSPRASYERRRRFPAYKANRQDERMDDPSVPIQMARIEEILVAWGLPIIRVPGWEADDVIATLARRFSGMVDVVAVSRDKDLHQLVDDTTFVFDPQTGNWWGRAQVRAKWGVPPELVVEVQNLMGDGTDNVPGVRDIGEARARDLVQRFGSVDGVLAHSHELSPHAREQLQRTDLVLQRFLVELKDDLELGVELEDLAFRGLDHDNAGRIFRRLGIRRWR